MSILIRGMETPTSCIKCKLCVSYKCVLTGEIRWSDEFDYDSKRFENCPLVPVPPHGRLIDAKYVRDKIIQKWMDKADDSHMYKCGMEDAYEVIRNAPTIIPEEKEGE